MPCFLRAQTILFNHLQCNNLQLGKTAPPLKKASSISCWQFGNSLVVQWRAQAHSLHFLIGKLRSHQLQGQKKKLLAIDTEDNQASEQAGRARRAVPENNRLLVIKSNLSQGGKNKWIQSYKSVKPCG